MYRLVGGQIVRSHRRHNSVADESLLGEDDPSNSLLRTCMPLISSEFDKSSTIVKNEKQEKLTLLGPYAIAEYLDVPDLQCSMHVVIYIPHIE